MELTPGRWHVRMRAKNTVGWSAFSAQHDFVINDNESDAVDAYGDVDNEDTARRPGCLVQTNTPLHHSPKSNRSNAEEYNHPNFTYHRSLLTQQ
ncbi:uncharacterized protein LOC105215939 isoform X2 [Zeugodacus cucurbitae]|uniref:uncharacterized protein LOC105215939 isoform X2 n=1 Tax=Zeugodacus cucurbitae TaxID=28588 RepID=UPI0023D92D15|nr:uncharacterized protein LOC105215939 isoform X2 [Zeugodacus cucurbitae]